MRRLKQVSARALLVALAITVSGCGGVLVRLAKEENWEEIDRRAREMKKPPRGKAARAWAQALVKLDKVEEARALLLRDFMHGGDEASLMALADLERALGLRGMAAAHYTRVINLDLDTAQKSPEAASVCELLRERARVEAVLGEALAADSDMRRLALTCPSLITEADRGFMSSLQPGAQAQAEGQRTLPSSLEASRAGVEAQLAEQLELARKRSPRAMMAAAESVQIQLEPDDIAVLLAAEFGGALGPGFVSSRRLSGWVGDNEVGDVIAAIDTLPDGVREYALLRLAGVRSSERLASEREAWIVAAMDSVSGQGAHEAAKAWRVSASVGELSGAEFALNTSLRDMIPVVAEPDGPGVAPRGMEETEGLRRPAARTGIDKPSKSSTHWSRRVPVDRRSFDLLLTLARLFELREQPVLALELRRSVIVAGYEVGLAQVGPAAAEEVLRQLALGRPWQALAVAEAVPGPMIDEVLPAIASALALAKAAKLDEAIAADRNVVWRALGDAWFESWDPRIEAAMGGLDLRATSDGQRCPELGEWLIPEQAENLRRVGLDPELSRAALEAALTRLDAPETGVALTRAIEADLGLACSAPLINLLHAGPHRLALETLWNRLMHAPELRGTLQLQLQAEIMAAQGEDGAVMQTTVAAAESVDPRSVWARAATAGGSFGAREYTLEALRQVILHSDGLDDPAARRELLLIRLRDVDRDEVLRAGDRKAVEAVQRAIQDYLDEAPAARRWARLDELLWAVAREPRADELAWTRLRSILEPMLDDQVAARHPDAVAALARAWAEQESEAEASGDPSKLKVESELAYLSDADAICELDSVDPQRLLGIATACGPRARAEALAALGDAVGPEARADVRAHILSGPIAAEIDDDRPGVLHAVPSLTREGASLRVAFDLPLDPVWITTPPQR